MEKEILRQKILNKRIEFSSSENFAPANEAIERNIEAYLRSIPSIEEKVIGAYYPVKGEVDILGLVAKFANKAFPRLSARAEDEQMEYALIEHLGDLSRSKTFGLMVPGEKSRAVVPDILLIPGLVFDENYNRLGYGKGYFDKFLSKIVEKNYNPVRIGICFDFQLLERMEVEAHDQKMDVIITETGAFSVF